VSGAIEVQQLSLGYDSRGDRGFLLAVSEVSASIQSGEFFVIVGPSGCGKTSLLNAIDGLIKPVDGRISIDGQRVQGPGPDRAMVFQEYALFPWRTVWENVKFGLELRRQRQLRKGDPEARIAWAVRLVGLAGFERAYPHELSGGMRQRAGLARALVVEPKILLMDEPFAAIDAMTREVMQTEIERIIGQTGQTVIFITHSIDEAIVLADRVAVMTARPGRFKEVIEVKLPRPRYQHNVRTLPEYAVLRDRIWGLLRTEMEDGTPVAEAQDDR
jgi:NitT/TauT family transport system ATP-binding protein